MLRFLVRHRITTAYIPEILVKMRSGGMSNASLKNRLLANRNDRLAWKVNGLKSYPWTLYLKPLRKVGQYIFNKCWPITQFSSRLFWVKVLVCRFQELYPFQPKAVLGKNSALTFPVMSWILWTWSEKAEIRGQRSEVRGRGSEVEENIGHGSLRLKAEGSKEFRSTDYADYTDKELNRGSEVEENIGHGS